MAAVANARIAADHAMSRPRYTTWLDAPPLSAVNEVVVVGAGIAGASTAYALAKRGIAVTVLEQQHIASGASGNHQGLLYAKITAADTAQNRLLTLAYPWVYQHLQDAFTNADFWHDDGVLQLAFDERERQRQQRFIQQLASPLAALVENWHQQDSVLNTLLPQQAGLWWPRGVRVSPPQWIKALLTHDLIAVKEQHPVHTIRRQAHRWQLVSQHGEVTTASHLILCAGAASDGFAPTESLRLRRIRGQVAYAKATVQSSQLQAAITGQHYVIPAQDGIHTLGASFVFNDENHDFRAAEHQQNLAGMAALFPNWAADFAQQTPQGRASIRADSIDHLPVAGPIAEAEALRQVYAKLAQDRHYPIADRCPYWPNLWLNTAHGTRGMLTAPICAESVVRRMLGEDDVLPSLLQDAIHPNRLLIRQLIYAARA